MIRFFPNATRTLVLALSREEVAIRMEMLSVVRPDAPHLHRPLTGVVKEGYFQVTVRAKRLNGFAPVVAGKMEETSAGCLIFLEYSLLPSTRFYLTFWTLIIVLSGAAAAFHYGDLRVGLASLGILVLIHGIAWANFNLHFKALHDTLLKALE